MPRTTNEQELIARVTRRYALGACALLQDIDRTVCGCDYAGTSWATRGEIDDVRRRLALAPGRRLLEVGAGAGWPALYLAKESGCDVTLTDLPLAGLLAARNRAAADGLAGACWLAAADGAALPFSHTTFDAVSHSDVLCCLADKAGVLSACRAAVCPGGRMVFSVILVAPGLSDADHARAVAGGPPVVDAPAPYPAMLDQSGWRLVDQVDLTARFRRSLRERLALEEANAAELAEVQGADDVAAMLERRRNMLGAVEAGLIQRWLFDAVPA